LCRYSAAPHSRHVAELRGVSDELRMYGGWGQSAVDPNSIVGLFLRRCCLDFERLTFEGTCKVFSTFTFYLSEGTGAMDDEEAFILHDEEEARNGRLKADEFAQMDVEIESDGAPLQANGGAVHTLTLNPKP
jgi:hypothetical protein